jgi:hypothetical protein
MALKVEKWVALPDLTANANDIFSLFRQLKTKSPLFGGFLAFYRHI